MDLWFTFPFFSSSITLAVLCYFTNLVVTLKFVIDEINKMEGNTFIPLRYPFKLYMALIQHMMGVPVISFVSRLNR
jgi:hypothetical protein